MDTEAFPAPPSVPFRTPSRSVSRHRRNSSLGISSSPPSLPVQHLPFDNDGNESGVDTVDDDTISPLDPRRFTPTLHANLVSEILSLRRELESKNKDLDKLEIGLADARNENEALSESLSTHVKENRSLKKQMKLLEGGTLSALSEIAKERDDAVENIGEIRKRLEQTQKKLKSQEEEVDRTQTLWDRDRQTWDSERRNWERKVHVAENRLKVVLNEVAAAQAANESRKDGDGENDTGNNNVDSSSVRSGSALDRRRTSTTSFGSEYDGEPINSGRYSSMSFVNGHGLKGNGLNLADELAFDEEAEEEYMDNELFDERPTSVASQLSYTMATKARKILGLSMNGNAEHVAAVEAHQVPEAAVDLTEFTPRLEYRDVGIQYTPPPSPPLRPSGPGVNLEKIEGIPAITIPAAPQMNDAAVETLSVEMVSASCQTVDRPSPPRTPESVVEEVSEPVKSAMVSTSTQTETSADEEEANIQVTSEPNPASPLTPAVPMIAIIPPGSEPTSPRNSVVLPPHTKSISCQTDSELSQDVRSVAMQTEEIRVDQRPVKLPASLLPSAIIDQPVNKAEADNNSMPFIALPPRSPYRTTAKVPTDPTDKNNKGKQPDRVQAYPGNNDNGPLAEDENTDIRRPFRSSSLFAGFETISDDEKPEPLPELPDVFSDDELYSRPTASYTLRSGRMVSRHRLEDDLLEKDEFDIDLPSTMQKRNDPMKKSRFGPKTASGSKQPDIRRTTLITNGAVAHQRTRPRSPSEPSIDSTSTGAARPPPFPVPVRLSSRNVGTSSSDGVQSPTPYSNGSYSSGRKARRIARQPTLRKVRSATAVQKPSQQDRARSRSPPSISTPAMSSSSYAPDSPQLPPPLPIDEMPLPRAKRPPRRIPSNRPPSNWSNSHTVEEHTSEYVQPTSVVDAIAQTMVGEWMFKYVRRRKSFGMSDTKETWELGKNTTEEVSANITSTGVRHKRWVWLAPYERAVMWSSKQPTSGPALLGKSGRKLTIQSVLDVKDDTPLPKGSDPQSQFNRSILILTPQRALKFTAMTLERHYVWLTALSFLSHSPMGINDLAALPPVPQEEYAAPPPTASLRRNHIRDSIRVAKGKPRPQPSKRSFTGHIIPMPEYPGAGFDLDPIMDAADPPSVPRYSGHNRKRSNTAPRVPPPSAFRSFSSHATLPSNYSANSSDIYAPSSIGAPGLVSGQSSISRRTSEASGPSSVVTNNFFDAVGTIRMEAFIDRVEGPRHRGQRNRAPRKRESSQWGQAGHDLDFTRSEDGSDIYYRNDDLFRGF